MKKLLKILALIVMTVLCLSLVACGESESDYPYGSPNFGGEIEVVADKNQDRVIYYSANIGIQAREVTFITESLLGKIEELNGIVSQEKILYTKNRAHFGYIYSKVPSEHLNELIDYIGENFDFAHKEISEQDLTQNIREAQAKFDALHQTKASLESLLQDQTLSITERLNVIERLEKVNSSIAEAQSKLSLKYQDYEYAKVVIKIGKEVTFWKEFMPVLFILIIPACFVIAIIILIHYFDNKKYGKQIRRVEMVNYVDKEETTSCSNEEKNKGE